MTEQEQNAIMTLVLMATFADGRNDAAERAEVTRIAESLSTDGPINMSALYGDVLLKRASVDQAVAALTSPDTRRLAYELCVGVCNADGAQGDAERAFLSDVQGKLGLDAAGTTAAGAVSSGANALASAPLAVVSAVEPPPQAGAATTAEQDQMILHYAILNGALELLPDSLASMAIIPLQMRMVYRIGKSHGYELDRGHIKDFFLTAGVGMASQYVEGIGARLVRGVFGRGLIGGLLGGLAGQVVSSGLSFATTYALGRLAQRYYSGGRTLSTQLLKDTYASLLEEAKGLQGQHRDAILEKARTINVAQVLQEVRQ